MNNTLIGTVFYASKRAQENRYYFEGRKIGTNNYYKAIYIADNLVQIDFDSTGTNYIHLTLTEG